MAVSEPPAPALLATHGVPPVASITRRRWGETNLQTVRMEVQWTQMDPVGRRARNERDHPDSLGQWSDACRDATERAQAPGAPRPDRSRWRTTWRRTVGSACRSCDGHRRGGEATGRALGSGLGRLRGPDGPLGPTRHGRGSCDRVHREADGQSGQVPEVGEGSADDRRAHGQEEQPSGPPPPGR